MNRALFRFAITFAFLQLPCLPEIAAQSRIRETQEDRLITYVQREAKVRQAERALQASGGRVSYRVREGNGKYAGYHHIQMCRATFDRLMPVVNLYVKDLQAPVFFLDVRKDVLIRLSRLRAIPVIG